MNEMTVVICRMRRIPETERQSHSFEINDMANLQRSIRKKPELVVGSIGG
jgi:hypothetical protein